MFAVVHRPLRLPSSVVRRSSRSLDARKVQFSIVSFLRPLAPDGNDGGRFSVLVEKVGSSIQKSRNILFSKHLVWALPPVSNEEAPLIWWRKGDESRFWRRAVNLLDFVLTYGS